MAQTDTFLIKASQVNNIADGGSEIRVDLQLNQAPPIGRRVLQGTVTDDNGNPVEDALVKLLDIKFNPVVHEFTNPQGNFIFNQLNTGSYVITAKKSGYGLAPVQNIALPDKGVLVVNIKLSTLPPQALNTSIYGIISSAQSGKPIKGAAVTVINVTEDEPVLFAQTTTNESGQYFVASPPEGAYLVQADAFGFILSPPTKTIIEDDDKSQVDIALEVHNRENQGTVSGIITDINGAPISGAFVALYSVTGEGETLVQLARTINNGLYLFINVEPGEYRVKAKGIEFNISG